MPVDMTRFLAGFFDEVAEHLGTIEDLLLAMDQQRPSRDDLDALFRSAHSIKGGSATFGFTAMAAFTHRLESLLDAVRADELPLSAEIIDTTLEAVDVLREQLQCYREGQEPAAGAEAHVSAALERLLNDAGAPVATASQSGPSKTFQVVFRPSGGADVLHALREGLRSSLASLGTLAHDDDANDEWRYTLETTKSGSAIAELFEFVLSDSDELSIVEKPHEQVLTPAAYGFFDLDEPQTAPAPAEAAPAAPAATGSARGADSSSIRVDLAKIDKLINLVGEIVIADSVLAKAAQELDPARYEELHRAIEAAQRHTRDLREHVMSIRLMPIGYLFNRFPRMVRDIAGRLDKSVKLSIVGEEIELDKGVIEQITDPLTHLVRNSIDHGIETAQERERSGKAASGSLTLRASHAAGSVIIEVIDDGRGLDRDKIIAKARALGIDVDEDASDDAIADLIFLPGFSTSAQVSDLSGRGVGMDVVRRNIVALGGTVAVESRPGRGSTVRVTLPLTVAIVDGMSVCLGGEIYIIPLSFIVESTQPRREEIQRVGPDRDVLYFRGEPLAVIPLRRAFNMQGTVDYREGIFVVVESEGRRAALFVDALEGQQQVVVKSLEQNFRRVEGISGATVLGNGHVALILDVRDLLHRHGRQGMVA